MKRILVVDDDATIRDVIALVLEEEGWSVTTAANGVEALSKMRAITQDLVLLDLMMPMLDGWSVLGQRQVDPALSTIPVVAMSAGGQLALERARALGADECVSKPFELENVLGIVRDMYRAADRHGHLAESGS